METKSGCDYFVCVCVCVEAGCIVFNSYNVAQVLSQWSERLLGSLCFCLLFKKNIIVIIEPFR